MASSVVDILGAFSSALLVSRISRTTHMQGRATEMAKVAAEQRRDAMIELHKSGWSYADIGKVVGVSRQAVFQTINSKAGSTA